MRHAARLARYASAAGDRRLVGRTFDGWHLDAVLGHGRFGTCYRASRGDDRVALKLIKPEHGALDREALWIEAKALSLCDHPAIPRWLGLVRERDEASDRGRCFMAQTLMPGTSLDKLLFQERRGFDDGDVLALGRQLLATLAHLEERGVAHNDVRPANLLVDESGTLSLVDFGLATFPERGEPVAADRAGFADVLLFLLYANPDLPRRERRGAPWFEELALSDEQRTLLSSLFAGGPPTALASVEGPFERAFSR